ncbi:MAG: ACT domain-containing protein, partial [Bacillota bacterium]
GNKCVGAKVNGKIVPISTKLENCDVVEILTNPASKGPSRDWLKFVESQQARTKIKAFFRKTLEPVNIKTGKDMLEHEAKAEHYVLNELLANEEFVRELLAKNTLNSVDDLFAAVGYGGIKCKTVIRKLIDAHNKLEVINKKKEPEAIEQELDGIMEDIAKKQQSKKGRKSPQCGILIDGHSDFLVKLGKCCNPVPGDTIVGYAARGTGVTAHRIDCPNIANLEPERMMNATWCTSETHMFTAELKIEAANKDGLLGEITNVISNQNLSLTKVVATAQKKKNTAIIIVGVSIKSIEYLQILIFKLEQIGSVISVSRNV